MVKLKETMVLKGILAVCPPATGLAPTRVSGTRTVPNANLSRGYGSGLSPHVQGYGALLKGIAPAREVVA